MRSTEGERVIGSPRSTCYVPNLLRADPIPLTLDAYASRPLPLCGRGLPYGISAGTSWR
jgi:hypothetical protein